jgi:dihydroxyacetone kinase
VLVEVVFVADDVALDAHKKSTGRRGVAGTVLVHKVVGAAAEAGT